MAYKYKLNPVTGKLDLVNKEEGSGGGIEEINSADKSIRISKNNKSIDLSVGLSSSDSSITITPTEGNFDITAPSLKMLEGYKCGFGTTSTTGYAKFCDLFWTKVTGALDTLHHYRTSFQYVGNGYIINYSADMSFSFGEANGKQICEVLITNETAYTASSVSAGLINTYKISNIVKVDYIEDASRSSGGDPSKTTGWGHAAVVVKIDMARIGNLHINPLSSLAIIENNSNLCWFRMNPECVSGRCSVYTPRGTVMPCTISDPIGNIQSALSQI